VNFSRAGVTGLPILSSKAKAWVRVEKCADGRIFLQL